MTAVSKQTSQGLMYVGLAIPISVIVGWVGYLNPGGYEPIVGALIWTGRLAFLIFLIPLFARPLRQLVKTDFTARLMRWRRNAGICYGTTQAVHLVIVWMMFATLANPPTEEIMVIVGGAGLALAIAMLITSFPVPTKAVGPKVWKWIHKAGFYVFMFIYFYDFVVEPILFDHPMSHLPWTVMTVLGISVRMAVMFKRSHRMESAA